MQVEIHHKSKHVSSSHAVILLFLLLLLGAGCTPKTTLQTPPPPPPPTAAQPSAPSISQILHQQYAVWKGTPHRTGGSDRRGIDCSGLMQNIFRDAFGVELPRTSAEQSQAGRKIPRNSIQPGDLIYFKDKRGDHVGVALDQRSFLHTSATLGVMISELDRYWSPRLKRISRVLSSERLASLGLRH